MRTPANDLLGVTIGRLGVAPDSVKGSPTTGTTVLMLSVTYDRIIGKTKSSTVLKSDHRNGAAG